MTLRLSLLGALALSFAAAGAYAQNTQHNVPIDNTPATDTPAENMNTTPPADLPADVPPPADASTMALDTPAAIGVPANVADTSASTTTMENGVQVTHTVVTNGPVADTPENRRLYGAPMSRAGRRTAAAGN